MSSQVEVGANTKVDDGGFASGALHFDLDGVVAGDLEAGLDQHSAWVTLAEAFRNVAHDDLVARNV